MAITHPLSKLAVNVHINCCVKSLGCLGNSVLPLGNELNSVGANATFMQVNEITVTPVSRRLYFYDGRNRNPANIQAQDFYNPTANRARVVLCYMQRWI